jgi:hypothetical protein
VSLDQGQVAFIQHICPRARQVAEAGQEMVLLPGLKVSLGSEIRVMDGLLCPFSHSNYSTRLFLSESLHAERPMIGPHAANWSTHILLGQAWHTWSWNNVPAHLPLAQMLVAHLEALR